jgi:hypothetical protein
LNGKKTSSTCELLAFINLRKNLAAEKRTPWRLRLDELFDMESLYIKGIQSLQLATQPFMETWHGCRG